MQKGKNQMNPKAQAVKGRKLIGFCALTPYALRLAIAALRSMLYIRPHALRFIRYALCSVPYLFSFILLLSMPM